MESGQNGPQKVKISGDGASISRISNYIIMSFSLLSDKEDVMSPKGEICSVFLMFTNSNMHSAH